MLVLFSAQISLRVRFLLSRIITLSRYTKVSQLIIKMKLKVYLSTLNFIQADYVMIYKYYKWSFSLYPDINYIVIKSYKSTYIQVLNRVVAILSTYIQSGTKYHNRSIVYIFTYKCMQHIQRDGLDKLQTKYLFVLTTSIDTESNR